MAHFKRLLVVAVVLLVLFFGNAAVFLYFNGKAIIVEKASQMLHRPVTAGDFRLEFPMVIHLKDLNVEGLLWVEDARVRCDMLTLMGRNFHLARVDLVNPILTLHRAKDNQIIWAEHFDEGAIKTAPEKIANVLPPPKEIKATIRFLTVENGQIHFPSHASNDPVEASLNNIQLTAKNVPLSGQSMDAGFDFSGMIDGDGVPFAGDRLKGSGRVNWPERNMDAIFKVVGPQGKIDVEVNLNSKNNDMMVRGHVKTRRMNLQTKNSDNGSMEHLLLDAMESAGMEVDLDFSFPIKMDRWELRNIDFSGNLSASDEGKTGPEKAEDLKNIGQ